jgi:hypothetical protein
MSVVDEIRFARTALHAARSVARSISGDGVTVSITVSDVVAVSVFSP